MERAAEVRRTLVRLGPAFIKAGQALSIRPDLLPGVALKELQRLCDDCPVYDWDIASAIIEEELGRKLEDVFEGLGPSPKPMAAASLGQVYKWRLRGDDVRHVAVKVQRPDMSHVVSLDIHILRKIAGVLRTIFDWLTCNRIDHLALVDAWARGTIGELDYEAEAAHQERFRTELGRTFAGRVYVPSVYHALTSRRVLVTEWIEGPRLADCPPEVVRELCPVGIECFLSQLLDIGLFHSDPHPGNLLVSEGRLVLLDFGLVAEVEDFNVSRLATVVVHLINADHEELLDDFIALGFLPHDIDKEKVLPPIKSVLEQGMRAGANIRRRTKNFQAISEDLGEIFYEMPFSVPPYFALITRALATLEGIALVGDPEFDIFWAAYPFALSRAAVILGPRRTGGLLTAAAAHAALQMPAQQRAELWAGSSAKAC